MDDELEDEVADMPQPVGSGKSYSRMRTLGGTSLRDTFGGSRGSFSHEVRVLLPFILRNAPACSQASWQLVQKPIHAGARMCTHTRTAFPAWANLKTGSHVWEAVCEQEHFRCV